MSIHGRLRQLFQGDRDALAPHRDDIAVHLSGLSVLLLLPFTVNHLVQGRWALGVSIALAQAVLVLNAWSVRRGRTAPVHYGLLVTTLVGTVGAAVHLQGLNGVFWAYPTLFIAYFLLARALALGLSALLVVGVTTIVALTMDGALAARVGATLTLNLVMINVVLNVLGQLQSALVRQAITDPLTGLYNRRHLQTHLDGLDRPGGVDHALLSIDIDHFKQINDRHGHAAGDEVLKRFAEVLTQRTRRGDLLFRTGGEEFVLLLPGATLDDARALADDLRQRVADACLLPGTALTVTVSIGIAQRRRGDAHSDWLRQADAALYRAKRGGRNRVVTVGDSADAAAAATDAAESADTLRGT
jgi:diguanylate cyclase (GGDEF)-like protein